MASAGADDPGAEEMATAQAEHDAAWERLRRARTREEREAGEAALRATAARLREAKRRVRKA